MKVTVTAEHIRNGRRGYGGKCPLALALGDKGVSAYVGYVYVTTATKEGAMYRTSTAAKKFIHHFDQGKKVKPATFTLRSCK